MSDPTDDAQTVEAVVNGVLCYKTPDSKEFVPYTPEAMTIAFIAMRGAYERERKLTASLTSTIVLASEILRASTVRVSDVNFHVQT